MVLVLLLPPLLAAEGGRVTEWLSYGAAGAARGRGRVPGRAATWPAGLAVVAAWAVGAWLLGAALLERRDV